MHHPGITRPALVACLGLMVASTAIGAEQAEAEGSAEQVPATTIGGGALMGQQAAPARSKEVQLPAGQSDLGAGPLRGARAGTWNFAARAKADLTLSSNPFLAAPGREKGDVALGLSLPLSLRRAGPRALLFADYVPTLYLYGRNSGSDYVQNNLRAFASLEAVDNLVFVDALAHSFPTYVSAFLPRPDNGASITQNRTQRTTLGLSPYLRHDTQAGWSYLIRNDNVANTYNDATLSNSFASRFSGRIDSPPARLSLGADYTYLYTHDEAQPSGYYQQLARLRPMLRARQTTSVNARIGYENNDYSTTGYSGSVYGAGIVWTPNPRTKLDAFLEHRFFGASYGLDFNYRTRRTLWRVRGLRNTITPIEQPLTQRPATTAELLESALRARITDPAERERVIRQFLDSGGLPAALTQPYSFYASQVYLAEQWTGTVAVLGRRNTIELAALWQDNEPLTSDGTVSPASLGFTPFSQRGLTMNFSHRLTGFTSAVLGASRLYSHTTGATPHTAAQSESTLDTVRLALTHRLSLRTDASIGVRWSTFDSATTPYRERAVLAAVAHGF